MLLKEIVNNAFWMDCQDCQDSLQLLGYADVVGTLWEVEQTAAARFARGFYGALARRVGSGDGEGGVEGTDVVLVARAAHEAMVELRAEDPEDTVTWAPMVCFGA
jgi:hypothetical protein